MKSFSLASLVWCRAWVIYLAMHLLGIVVATIASAIAEGTPEAIGFFTVIAFFSCGLALVCGAPSLIGMAFTTLILAPLAARYRMLMPLILIAGLLFTKLALFLSFDVVFEGELGPGDNGLVLFFSILSYVSMIISVVSYRRAIDRHSNHLAGTDTSEISKPFDA